MIVILGGGISGIATAWFLKQRTDQPIILLEKAPRLGGWIQSTTVDGFFFEKGPRSLRPQGGEETLRLIQELGLEDQVVLGESAAHERYLYFNDSLRKLPRSFKECLLSPWMWSIVPSLLTEWTKGPSELDDESIYEFISRRLSPHIAHRFMDPMTQGIFAGDIQSLSMKSCFPKIYNLEKEHGSITRGVFAKKKKPDDNEFISWAKKSSLYTLQDGLASLVKRLAAKLNADIKLSTPVTGLDFEQNQILVKTPDHTFTADRVISTLPANALAPLLQSPVSDLLSAIPMKTLSVVNLGFHQSVLHHHGFGYLIPSSEGEKVLGVVWDSSAFPTQNQHPDQTRLTVMMHEYDEEAMHLALRRHLGITQAPDYVSHNLMQQAIPQYTVGHSQRLAEIRDRLPTNFHMVGNSFEGVSVNDCILQAINLREKTATFYN